MEHKTWLWRKKSTDKMIPAADKVDVSSRGNEDEVQTLLADKAELENDLKVLNDKLSSALFECNSKDDLVKKHKKMAQEAVADQEKAEANSVSLKQELEAALQQRAAGEQRLTHLDAAFKECMQQLRFVRDEQEQRIHDAVIKTSREFEKSQIILEEKLGETSKRLAKIGVENTHLSKALLSKEKLIDNLSKQKAQVEADFNALMSRLESTEKDNASLKYEVRVLEKELEIRNEEREFNRRTADASHRQHLDSVKRIVKLESECQRLRLLVCKRLPGPAALAKMKSEVEILGRDSVETRRRRSNSSLSGFVVDAAADKSPETSTKKINLLIEQVIAMEEENKTLREALNKKATELQFSRAMYARTVSKLSQTESHLDEMSKGQTNLEPSRSIHKHSLASMSDIGSDDKASCAESWASALISELEHFKNGKQRSSPSRKTVGASEINLMDDFVEMERLAIASVDKQSGSPQVSSHDVNAILSSLETELTCSSEATSREIIPVSDSGSGMSNKEIKSKDKAPGWLQDILKVIAEQNRVSHRKPDEILEYVNVALANGNHAGLTEYVDPKESLKNVDASNVPQVTGYISWKPAGMSLVVDSSGGLTDVDALLSDKSNQEFQSDLSKSIGKIIELIEGITLPNPDYSASDTLSRKDGSFFSYKSNETPSGYMVRVFQWKTSELSHVLQQFVHSCYDMLNGKYDVKKFSQELYSALEWIMNHCFSLQDVSSMRDAVKEHFDWNEPRNEGEAEIGMISQFSEGDILRLSHGQLSSSPIAAAANGHHNYFEKDECVSSIRDENKKLKDELISLVSGKKELEGKLELAADKSESLTNQLQESERTITNLQTELENLKGVENQIGNHKLVRDLDKQLKMAKVELNEARQKFSSLEVELENRSNCCEELEAACLDLELQLESVTKKSIPDYELHQEEKQLRTDQEITAASEKLAECQETILNLGKQLKALASPKEAAPFDKVTSAPSDTNTTSVTMMISTAVTSPKIKIASQRSSLLHRMLAEDSAKIKESDSNVSSAFASNGVIEPLEKILILNGRKHYENDVAANSLAIVPSKKRGGASLWRKLIWTKKKSNSKKQPLAFAA